MTSPTPRRCTAQFDRVIEALADNLPTVARADILALTGFPNELWRQIWSNNPHAADLAVEALRTDVVGIFSSS